jgi:hypothetical protein
MSKATEKKIIESVDELITDLEEWVEAKWENPAATPAYFRARAEFREALEARIRNSEWLKER